MGILWTRNGLFSSWLDELNGWNFASSHCKGQGLISGQALIFQVLFQLLTAFQLILSSWGVMLTIWGVTKIMLNFFVIFNLTLKCHRSGQQAFFVRSLTQNPSHFWSTVLRLFILLGRSWSLSYLYPQFKIIIHFYYFNSYPFTLRQIRDCPPLPPWKYNQLIECSTTEQ